MKDFLSMLWLRSTKSGQYRRLSTMRRLDHGQRRGSVAQQDSISSLWMNLDIRIVRQLQCRPFAVDIDDNLASASSIILVKMACKRTRNSAALRRADARAQCKPTQDVTAVRSEARMSVEASNSVKHKSWDMDTDTVCRDIAV